MSTVKSLAIIALLLGGTSVALAQTPPTAGPNPPTGGPNPYMQSAAPPPTSAAPRTRTAHRAPHARIFMQAQHIIPGCTVGAPAGATCACGTGASGGPLLCQTGQWCHYPFASACTQ
jgi:hypothetical protein